MTSAARRQPIPISRICVVSTGTVQVRPQHVGPTRQNMYLWLLTARRWTPPLPINVYLIAHREGLVLFDTGQDLASVNEPGYFPGGVTGYLYGRAARISLTPEQSLAAGLRALGHRLDEVHTVVLSHTHMDHIGGLTQLRAAEIVIADEEWQDATGPRAELRGFLRSHLDVPGLRWRRIHPEALDDPWIAPFRTGHDLFGDGSLTLLPTPGHTAGSLSLLVRRPGRPALLLVGDLSFDHRLLRAGRLPGVGHKPALRTSTTMVNGLWREHPDLVVLPTHDPTAAERLCRAETDQPLTR